MSATITSGRSRARGLQHGAAILHHAHQIEVFGEQTLQRLGDQPVIIGEQHPRAIRAPASQRHPRNHGGAVAGLALDVDLASEQADPLAHAHLTEAGTAIAAHRIETATVVAHGELQTAVTRRERHDDRARLGVTGDVAQRFLGHTKQAERRVRRQRLREVGGNVRYDSSSLIHRFSPIDSRFQS